MSRFHKTIYSLFIFTLMTLVTIVVTLTPGTTAKAATQDVTLSTTVLPYLSFTVTAGGTVSFGNLTPGTPICYATGTVASVTTNAANGYTLGVSDGSDTNSALVHTDTTSHIADYAGTIATPTTWTGTGLGVTLFAADTTKEAKWGTGTTVCDASNKYAGIPSGATTSTDLTVSGAGSTEWNGGYTVYTSDDGTGHPLYKLDDTHWLHWSPPGIGGPGWVFALGTATDMADNTYVNAAWGSYADTNHVDVQIPTNANGTSFIRPAGTPGDSPAPTVTSGSSSPSGATAHTVTGVVSGVNTSSWGFKVDVPNTQKTGAYSGIATMTATAVLS